MTCTYVDHSIGGDAEEGGALVDGLDLLAALHGHAQGLELAQRALQCRAVLGDQVVARAQIIQLVGQRLQGALDLAAVRLRRRLLVARVIWRGEREGRSRSEFRGQTHSLMVCVPPLAWRAGEGGALYTAALKCAGCTTLQTGAWQNKRQLSLISKDLIKHLSKPPRGIRVTYTNVFILGKLNRRIRPPCKADISHSAAHKSVCVTWRTPADSSKGWFNTAQPQSVLSTDLISS